MMEKQFKQFAYYFKKHKIDTTKINQYNLYEAYEQIRTEKKATGTLLSILIIGIALCLYAYYEAVTYGGTLPLICFCLFMFATIYILVVTRKNLKRYHYRYVFSKGTSKEVEELFKKIRIENKENEFIDFLKEQK